MRNVRSRGAWLFALALLGESTHTMAQSFAPHAVPNQAGIGAHESRGSTLLEALPTGVAAPASGGDGEMVPGPVGTPPKLRASRTPASSMRQGVTSPNISTVPITAGLTLSGVINTALNANPDLRSATERIRIADATLVRARAEFYPKLSLTEAFFDTNLAGLAFFLEVMQRRISLTQNFNHPGFVGNFSTFVTLQHNLYSGGRRTAEALSAEEQRRAASFGLAAARNAMVFQVAEAYFRLLQARELMESRSAAVRQIERHVALVRSRYDNGTAVRSDVLSVEVKLAEAREGLITATNQLELTWAILENVTGCRLPHELASPAEPSPWSARVEAVESAIAEAVNRRPETRGIHERGSRRCAPGRGGAFRQASERRFLWQLQYVGHQPQQWW